MPGATAARGATALIIDQLRRCRAVLRASALGDVVHPADDGRGPLVPLLRGQLPESLRGRGALLAEERLREGIAGLEGWTRHREVLALLWGDRGPEVVEPVRQPHLGGADLVEVTRREVAPRDAVVAQRLAQRLLFLGPLEIVQSARGTADGVVADARPERGVQLQQCRRDGGVLDGRLCRVELAGRGLLPNSGERGDMIHG